ncbi:MAG: hypothetical protein E7316_03565 [Clostridiales bacterium]|nr:hypothetical protein [Clostridiales bacterium]
MKNQNTHALLLTLVGGYILYIAYQLLDGLLAGKDEMPLAAAIAAIAVFVIGGIGVLIYAWKLWRDAGKQDETEPEDETTLK